MIEKKLSVMLSKFPVFFVTTALPLVMCCLLPLGALDLCFCIVNLCYQYPTTGSGIGVQSNQSLCTRSAVSGNASHEVRMGRSNKTEGARRDTDPEMALHGKHSNQNLTWCVNTRR